MSSQILIVGMILLIVIAVGVTFVSLRQLSLARYAAARERFPNAKVIIRSANFFGQESRGVMQLRGNGTLALTDTELFFEQWIPRREFRIPLSAIQAIEMPASFLGKTNFRPLLKVVFKDEAGNTDSMAWLVPNVEGLKRALEDAQP
jgi:hypothetical protein